MHAGEVSMLSNAADVLSIKLAGAELERESRVLASEVAEERRAAAEAKAAGELAMCAYGILVKWSGVSKGTADHHGILYSGCGRAHGSKASYIQHHALGRGR
jgi:hypothetical protein